ncbi:transcription factor MYB8-like [Nicotiana tabacum]|uniref:Transcription factor MYB35-like n=1 Tax=Nicotiana tabacum TaxID=4097 RepID=A0A1S3YM27_TOBAC|nr:PREDICTED: transcription factor MYB35-like [Nicotiana tabacum]
MGRPPCCSDKVHSRRCNWTEEDANTSTFVSKHGIGNWTAMSKKSGTGKCGRSQKNRWSNRLKTDLKEDSFTHQEEELIIKLHATIGSRWSIIAQQIPGRTDNEVKNLWNTKLKKKLSAMGIDPVTHKPFSQILTDYGNIGGFPKARTRFVSLNRELKGAFMSTPEQLQHPLERFPNFNSHCVTTIRLQKTETSEDCFLSNNYDSSNNQPPVDLLSELQAIKFVTEASNNNSPKAIFSYTNPITDCSLSSPLSSSSSSSASHSLTSNQVNWCDYLLDDVLLPSNFKEQETVNIEEKLVSGTAQEYRQNNAPATKDFETTLSTKGTSPSSSFVEDMLECEYEMFLNFPGLSEDPFY